MNTTTKEIPCNLEDISKTIYLSNKHFLIFDIETTGFSRENEIIYMIGCIFKTNKGYEYYNMFATDPSKEYELINHFFNMLKDFDCIIHFNGNRFDIPFLLARAAKYNIIDTISNLESIDIYDLLRPLRKSLDFPDLKLDTIQEALGYRRKDTSTGGDLIPIYHRYAEKPYKPYYQLLLLHNQEDVEGMIHLLPIIDLMSLINQVITHQDVKVVDITESKDAIKILYKLSQKVLIDFKLSSKGKGQLKLTANSNLAVFTLPLCNEEKKFFFDNYKDYMYIIEKDEVMHKSIANFIPTHKKKRARKSNCFIWQRGPFIPILWPNFKSNQQTRLFRDKLRSKEEYILASSELDKEFYKNQLAGFLMLCKGL